MPTYAGATATLTGTFIDAEGNAASGNLLIRPEFTHAVNTTTNFIAVPETINVMLNAAGSFSIVLQATDDPAVDPVGFTYHVDFDLHEIDIPSFSFALPAGSTVDLADAIPLPSTTGTLMGKLYIQSNPPTSPQVNDVWIQI